MGQAGYPKKINPQPPPPWRHGSGQPNGGTTSDNQPLNAPLTPNPFALRTIRHAFNAGRTHLRAMPGPSLALGGLIAAPAFGLLLIPFALGDPPLVLILAGGFALIGPLLLPGFFALRDKLASGARPGLGQVWGAYRQAGAGFWALVGVCLFLLLVWITDAGILYAFLVGAGAAPSQGAMAGAALVWANPGVQSFVFWASLLGAVMAAGVHLIAGFAVPLLYQGRAAPVPAIHASVRAMFRNPIPALIWALILILGLVAGLLLPPVLAPVLPLLAYAHYDLYLAVFPEVRKEIEGNGDSAFRQA